MFLIIKDFKEISSEKTKTCYMKSSRILLHRIVSDWQVVSTLLTLSRSVSVCLQLKTSCLWSSDEQACSSQCTDAADLISPYCFCWFVTLIVTLRSIVLLFFLHCEVWDECFVWESVSSVMVSVVKREDEAVKQNNKIHLGDLQLQKVTDSRSCYCWVNVIITHKS